jgi:colanic acid biosynthesis protein WcaH
MFIPENEYRQIVACLPILCVDVLIIYDDKCLLLKRDNEPAKGHYWFPGGRINKLETIRKAAIRKAKEETNLDCEFINIVTVEETIFMKNENMETDIHTVNICCKLTTNDISILRMDKNHNGFIWVEKQNSSFHSAINNPLSLIGIK